MTLEQLNEYLVLGETRARNAELLENLERAAYPKSPGFDAMPHGGGVSDRVGDLAAEIADVKSDIERIDAEMQHMAGQIEDFIGRVPDAQIKIVLRLRFLRCLSWKQVASVLGNYRTADSARHIALDYLRYNP